MELRIFIVYREVNVDTGMGVSEDLKIALEMVVSF